MLGAFVRVPVLCVQKGSIEVHPTNMKKRVVIFGTHPKQFNGYSKVVYELCKAMTLGHADEIEMHVFGFQNFYNHPGHRTDVPASVHMYDAHADELPKAAGFGVPLVKSYVDRIKPHVVVVFNDLMVLTSILNELKDAPNRANFKVVAYIDQVYLCQRADFVQMVNKYADAAIAFTPEWRQCIVSQGLTLPCHVLPHGINPQTYFPIPKQLARRYYGLPENDFLILNLNRNQPRKRWDTCLQAFAEVVLRLPDAPIKLVVGTDLTGAWDLTELYKRELKKRGIPNEVGMARLVIPGHPQMLTDEETNVLYNIADVGINTCDGEGFGLCNFEQAAIGIPQIVPRLGGFLHFFDPSIAAMVDPVLSIYVDSTRDGVGGEAQLSKSDDYADAIVAYYNDRELLARHGTCGRAAILSRFGWDKIADQFVDIIRAVDPTPVTTVTTPLSAAPPQQCVIPVDDIMRMLGDRSSPPTPIPPPPPPPEAAPILTVPITATTTKKRTKSGRRLPARGERQRNLADLLKLQKQLETLLGSMGSSINNPNGTDDEDDEDDEDSSGNDESTQAA